jgi:putative ABC transport system substrate-binding protein
MRLARLTLSTALALALLAAPLAAEAQPPGQVHRIGYLGTTPPTPVSLPVWNSFLQGLREHGYLEGRNLIVEARYTEGKAERFAEFATEFVRLKVDVIVAPSTPAARAAKAVTSTIPILTVLAADPVGSGLVQSLARPGWNVTGTTTQAADVGGKLLELLKEVLPNLSRVTLIWNPNNPAHRLGPLENAAQSLQLQLQPVEFRDADQLEAVLASIARQRADALLVLDDPVTFVHRRRLIDFAGSHRLPAAYSFRIYVQEGGLLAYDADWKVLFRRVGYYVDRLLKGAKPAELPVEQPTKFELVINLKTAKALGLTIPPSVLARADEVIE